MQKTKIDWREIKSRINTLQKSLDRKIILSPEEKHTLLKERAQALAVEEKDITARKQFIDIVVFSLATEKYGIENSFIREVYMLRDFTRIPGTPSFVFGIMNLRGQIIPVINLKKFFNLPEKGLGELNKVIILRNEKMEFAVLADVVEGTLSVALEDIMEAPLTVSGIGEKYLKGITKEHIVVLDAACILNDEKILVNEEVI